MNVFNTHRFHTIGEQGQTGPQGWPGPKGDKGDIGLTGDKGDKGEPNTSVVIPLGEDLIFQGSNGDAHIYIDDTAEGNTYYSIPDVGNAHFVMTEGFQTINGSKSFTELTTGPGNGIVWAGTPYNVNVQVSDRAANSNYLIPDAGDTGDFVMTSGAQTLTGTKKMSGGITFNNSAGGTSTSLGYYNKTSINTNAYGIWANVKSVNIQLVRIGDLVTIMIRNPSGISVEAVANGSALIGFDDSINTWFRPSQNIYLSIGVKSNGAASTGRLLISTAGVLQISLLDGAPFANTGVGGFINMAGSYIVG